MGNPLTRVESDGSRVTYSYDVLNQVTNENRSGGDVNNLTYTYDAAGNRSGYVYNNLLLQYTNNAANQLVETRPTTGTITTLTYDGKGNNLVEHAGSTRYTHT